MNIYQVYVNSFYIHFQLSHKKYITIVVDFGFTWAWNVVFKQVLERTLHANSASNTRDDRLLIKE